MRTAAAQYADGKSAPAGSDRPSPRLISDTLSDAAHEIRTQLARQPEVYGDFRGLIEAALKAMDAAREALDRAPGDASEAADLTRFATASAYEVAYGATWADASAVIQRRDD